MALPTFVNASSKASGTGAVTPDLPASLQANDIVILVATTIAGGSASITANGSIGTWNAVTGSPIDVTGGEKLYVWWGRWASGTTGPTVTPGSDHCCAGTVAYRGCITDATVINNQTTGSETTSDTSFSFATGISTTAADCMCIGICTSGADSNSGQVPVMANTSLAALASRLNINTNSGGGGGFGLSEGAKATAGTMGTWTATLAGATPKAYLTFALRPPNTVTTKTTTGRARIQKSVTQTQLGRANIALPTVTTTQTELGRARIQKSVTQTELGRARVQKTGTQTELGRARIQKTATQTETGLARIGKTATATQTGLARVQKQATQTTPGVGRIQKTTTQTTTGVAAIVVGGSVDQTITGVARIEKTEARTTTGVARVQAQALVTQEGLARITGTTQQTTTGVSRVQKPGSATITGVASITLDATSVQTITGVARIEAAPTPVEQVGRSTGGSTSIDRRRQQRQVEAAVRAFILTLHK